MLRKITAVLTTITAALVCGAFESQTIVAEGFFAEAIKEDFAKMAIRHQGKARYTLSSKPVKNAVLSIQRVKPGAPMQSDKYAVYGHLLIVNEINTFRSVTRAEAEKILKNRFPEWPGLGIHVPRLAIAEGAFPRYIVQRLINAKTPVTLFPDAASAAEIVAQEAGSIGILPLGVAPYRLKGVRFLFIDNIEPTPESVFSGKYPLGDLYYISIHPSAPPEIKEFYETLRSKKYRRKILKTGALPIL